MRATPLLLLVLALPAAADPLLVRVARLTSAATPAVVRIRRDLHRHPELSNREARTSRKVAARLKQLGIEHRSGIARHGVIGLIRGRHPGPTVALRADMDALPVTEATGLAYSSRNRGVMHACGHDSHTAVLLGAAEVLSRSRDLMHGSVKLLFQPAEEGPPPGEEGGAPAMVAAGALREPDVEAIFGLHAFPSVDSGKLGVRPGGMMASVDRFRIALKGKQVHAAYPWDGVDPVVAAGQLITALQGIVAREVDVRESAVLTVGVVQGGTRWNIVPDEVVLEGTIRALEPGVRKQVGAALRRVSEGVARAQRCEVEIEVEDVAPVTWNDPELLERMLPSLERAAGAGNVVDVKPSMGGEDFAFYAAEIPALFFRLGMRNPEIGATHALHTPGFRVDEATLPLGVRAMSLLALEYLRDHGDGRDG